MTLQEKYCSPWKDSTSKASGPVDGLVKHLDTATEQIHKGQKEASPEKKKKKALSTGKVKKFCWFLFAYADKLKTEGDNMLEKHALTQGASSEEENTADTGFEFDDFNEFEQVGDTLKLKLVGPSKEGKLDTMDAYYIGGKVLPLFCPYAFLCLNVDCHVDSTLKEVI